MSHLESTKSLKADMYHHSPPQSSTELFNRSSSKIAISSVVNLYTMIYRSKLIQLRFAVSAII